MHRPLCLARTGCAALWRGMLYWGRGDGERGGTGPMDALEIETRDGLQRMPLDKSRLTIGRLPGNDIVLPFASISRHHAELRLRGHDWWIADLGSTNGLHVAGRVVKEYLLRHGDQVVLAPSIILHFVSGKGLRDVTVEGTVQLPSMRPPSGPIPSPNAITAPAAQVAPPPLPNAAEIAAAASMPLPRRHLGLTAPPPSAAAPRYAPPGPAPLPAAPPPLSDNDLDAWLDDTPAAVEHPVVTPPAGPHLSLRSPFALMRRRHESPSAPAAKKPILYLCPTCGERTAPDSPYCWSCRQTIAQPCRACQLYLLPIQAACPRCHTPNHNAVRR